MATLSIKDALNELFTGPLRAVTEAEKTYRAIWIEWLRQIKQDLTLKDAVEFAPVVSLEQSVDASILLRIASVKESELSVGGGLQLGAISVSGRYGTVSRAEQESTFRADTKVQLSNVNADLNRVAKTFGATDQTAVAEVITLLEQGPREKKTARAAGKKS